MLTSILYIDDIPPRAADKSPLIESGSHPGLAPGEACRMRKFIAFAVALCAFMSMAQPANAADTIFVMRHLQKADGADPPLSAQGAANAQALVTMLGKSGIKAIFATPTRRAMETAQPLAEKLGLRVTAYDPAHPDALAKAVAGIDGAVLVVGHSNTVPDLVARFGGRGAVTVGDDDYGTLFVVTPADGKVRTMVVHGG